MQIGFNAPIAGPLSTPEALTRLAVEGEAMGYRLRRPSATTW